MNIETLLSCQANFKRKSWTELSGPCPACGGDDRFSVWPKEGIGGRFYCRQCGISGDLADYLERFCGYSRHDALDACGIRAKTYPDARALPSARLLPFRPAARKQPGPRKPLPNAQWRKAAVAFYSACVANSGCEAGRHELAERGLTLATALSCGVAVNFTNQYEARSNWGLDGYVKISLPAGLVISQWQDKEIIGLTVRRRDDAKFRYQQIAGSWQGPLILGKPGLPCVILESALDACLLFQEGGDLVSAIAMFGAEKPLDVRARHFIAKAAKVILCPDNDAGGEIALKNWLKEYPQAQVLKPDAKDIGEMEKSQIRPWLEKSLRYRSEK